MAMLNLKQTSKYLNIIIENIINSLLIVRFSEEKEVQHAFNITGSEGKLPNEEVPGFGSAVQQLAQDFKQLAAMLLTVIKSLCF